MRPINFGRDKLTCSKAAKSALDHVGTVRSLIGREERISFSGAVPIVKHSPNIYKRHSGAPCKLECLITLTGVLLLILTRILSGLLR